MNEWLEVLGIAACAGVLGAGLVGFYKLWKNRVD